MASVGETCPECKTPVMRTFMYNGKAHIAIEHSCGDTFVYDLEELVVNTREMDDLPLAAAQQLAAAQLGRA